EPFLPRSSTVTLTAFGPVTVTEYTVGFETDGSAIDRVDAPAFRVTFRENAAPTPSKEPTTGKVATAAPAAMSDLFTPTSFGIRCIDRFQAWAIADRVRHIGFVLDDQHT